MNITASTSKHYSTTNICLKTAKPNANKNIWWSFVTVHLTCSFHRVSTRPANCQTCPVWRWITVSYVTLFRIVLKKYLIPLAFHISRSFEVLSAKRRKGCLTGNPARAWHGLRVLPKLSFTVLSRRHTRLRSAKCQTETEWFICGPRLFLYTRFDRCLSHDCHLHLGGFVRWVEKRGRKMWWGYVKR